MLPRLHHPRRGRGQMVVVFALFSTVLVLAIGLVIDGGNALVQRRGSQNASDFASLAGSRIVAERIGGDTLNGTDANVVASINTAIQINGGRALTFGAPNGPRYVDSNGALLVYVGGGTIPTGAAGVTVTSDRAWRPFFLGIIGMGDWTATATATAKGGFCSDCAPAPGSLFPVGISLAFFQTYPFCSGDVGSSPACTPQHLTPGNLNVPGGFGWLKFGCTGYGLGQDPPQNAGGCQNNIPFLQVEIGPPSHSYGCCTAISTPGLDQIGSLPGNKVSADCSYYIAHEVVVTVPIWDTAGGTGSNAYYHVVGSAGFQLTGCSGGKNIEGVWRKLFFTGPTSTTPSGPPGTEQLGTQLVR